ncbi:hypothetical protein MTBSS4_310037 [Magnetospirillum sp. SS-4]|nr:hypothetical protein MTBSS4_310037 [Magnetospirillum sp. SS-4]
MADGLGRGAGHVTEFTIEADLHRLCLRRSGRGGKTQPQPQYQPGNAHGDLHLLSRSFGVMAITASSVPRQGAIFPETALQNANHAIP